MPHGRDVKKGKMITKETEVHQRHFSDPSYWQHLSTDNFSKPLHVYPLVFQRESYLQDVVPNSRSI